MILTDAELYELRHTLEAQTGLNEELLHRCGTLIHMGKFDEAVRSAFVLLEERLRKAANVEGMTGTNLANFAFNAENGPLAKHLGRTKQEREGLRELYAGAFKLFRNPTAHALVNYTAAEGKSIISLVNLLLIFLDRAPVEIFPEYIEETLAMITAELGQDVAARLRLFLEKSQKLGLISKAAVNWIPFRAYALQSRAEWPEPKPYKIAAFYLVADKKNPALWFPVNQYYARVVGLDTDPIMRQLRQLGFVPTGKTRDYRLNLRDKNDADFFEALSNLLKNIVNLFEETLS